VDPYLLALAFINISPIEELPTIWEVRALVL
jgi:hypothetical protein